MKADVTNTFKMTFRGKVVDAIVTWNPMLYTKDDIKNMLRSVKSENILEEITSEVVIENYDDVRKIFKKEVDPKDLRDFEMDMSDYERVASMTGKSVSESIKAWDVEIVSMTGHRAILRGNKKHLKQFVEGMGSADDIKRFKGISWR